MINLMKAAGVGVAVLVLGTGTGYAATGGSFILGRSNSAGGTTSLIAGSGAALALRPGPGAPPLTVTSGVKVPNLNVDKLDNLDSSQLQRRVSGSCAPGEAIRAINAAGAVACDDEQVSVVQTFGQTDQYGIGAAYCDPGYAPVSGGYYSDSYNVHATDATIGQESQGAGRFYYFAALANPDGSAVTNGTVNAVCVFGNIFRDTTGAALRRPDPLARAKARH